MLRQRYNDLLGSAMQTYTDKVLGWADFPRGASPEGVTVYGGNQAQWFDYPNGARLWLAGMDNPGDALSSERDYIYANQAEELAHRAWQTLLTRATGRAGHTPYPRVLGDANPGPPSHWILAREAAGHLVKLDSAHRDNPALYDDDGRLTAQGERTMKVLDSLEGVERDRLRDGQWVSAEGTVYQLQSAHLGDGLYVAGQPVELGIDPNNGAGPYACVVLQPSLTRVCQVDEFYRVGGSDEDLAEWLVSRGYATQTAGGVISPGAIATVVVDPAKPETADRLRRVIPGLHIRRYERKKDITAQINAVRAMLRVDPATHRSLYVVDRARCPMTVQEFGEYVWRKAPPSSPERNIPQEPEDAHNHCMDALAYWTVVRRPVAAEQTITLPPATRRPAYGWSHLGTGRGR